MQQSSNTDNIKTSQQNTRNVFLKTFNNPIKPISISYTEYDTTLNPNDKVKTLGESNQDCIDELDSINTQQISRDCNELSQQNKKIDSISTTSKLFLKTQTLLQYLADLSIFDSDTLQKGMKIDLSNNDSEFFELYIGSELHLACAYNYVLDERTFIKKDSPDLHFMRCEIIQKTPQDLLKVCVPIKNAFDYRVRSGGVDTRLFYEHPLHICPICIASLCQLLSKKHKRAIHVSQIKEEEVMGLLFKNKLKNLVM